MGDRGNIFFVDRTENNILVGVYMYTHWSGEQLPRIVRDALARGRDRWGDSQCLAAVVFQTLTAQAHRALEMGCGLSSALWDNEHKIIRIDDTQQRVSFHEPGSEQEPQSALVSWSYAEYIALSSDVVARIFDDADEDERSNLLQ